MQATGAAAAASALAGCPGGGSNQNERAGGVFTMGIPASPKGLNILTTSSAYSLAILDSVYDGGTFLDPIDFRVRPWVFTDWTAEETDGGLDVFFDVRDGLTFTDGEDLTLEDVKFTYRYLLEQNPGKYASILQPIESVEDADNDYDLHMRLNQVVGTYDSRQLQLPILPQHIWSEVDDYTTYQPGNRTDEGRPVGTGVATVSTYNPDTAVGMQLRPASEYQLTNAQWRRDHGTLAAGGPFVEEVRFKVYTSQSARVEALLNGDIDSIYSSIPPSAERDARQNRTLELVQGDDTGFGYVGFNLRRPPLDDLAFRQALTFLWDDLYWVRRLNRNNDIEGDFVMPPGYQRVRPEFGSDDAEMLTDPAAQAFHFRESSPGTPNIGGVRGFLTSGQLITGEGGTYAGQDYPGSLTGASASQSSPKHDYSFGPVQSSVLEDAGADREIRVNGRTVTDIRGGPLQYHSYPPEVVPELTEMDKRYVNNIRQLGIPIERQIIGFNQLLTDVFSKEDFDITHLGVGNITPFAVGYLYNTFHSDNADDHDVVEEGSQNDQANDPRQLNNFTGYGLEDAGADELIQEARTTLDTEQRNQLAREAVEQVYLDCPFMVFGYDKQKWPVNTADFEGFVGQIPGPGASNLGEQFLNVRQRSSGTATDQ